MLGKLRKVSHMVWFCVLTYQASQLSGQAPDVLIPFSKAHPELQKLLLAKAAKAEAPPAMAPPPVPPPRQEVVLTERP
eukprot:3575018-Amphidinium_carterae.1